MTLKTISFAKDVETGKEITTTIKDIIANRILWEGDSGSGKSHGMVGMIEETDDLAQRIIIDPEGEYFPLKDNFQFLLIGKKTEHVKPNVELNLNDVYVDKLIQKLIVHSIDAIIDLSESPGEATHFLKIFQIAVFKYAKLMKRPLLIFVDEGQIFAPEKGQGSEESLKAMKELAKRGRKRGIGLICGTQAIADFSKDVVRQLRTRFIGNCTYDNDVKAAAHFLGFGKNREPELRELADSTKHHFFVAGKAITIEGKKPTSVIKIEANENKTKLYDFDFDKNIKLKEKDAEVMKDLAANFSDIPQLIDEELNEKETLQKNNFELKKQVMELKNKTIVLERQQPKVDPKAIEKAYSGGYGKALKHSESQYGTTIKAYEIYIQGLKRNASNIQKVIMGIDVKAKTSKDFELILQTKPTLPEIVIPKFETPKSPLIPLVASKITHMTSSKNTKSASPPLVVPAPGIGIAVNENTELSGPEARIIRALLSLPDGKGTRIQVSFTAGYTASKGGGFLNPLGALRTMRLLEYQGSTDLIATQAAKEKFPDVEPLLLDQEALHKFWFDKLPGPEHRILTPIVAAYPEQISREEVAGAAGYMSFTGGGFLNPLGKLRSLGLIEYIGQDVKATAELFPGLLV